MSGISYINSLFTILIQYHFAVDAMSYLYLYTPRKSSSKLRMAATVLFVLASILATTNYSCMNQ